MNFENVEVHVGHKLPHTLTHREFEIDVISFDPLVVLECTGFVKELTKIQNLVTVKTILSQQMNKEVKFAFLVTYGIKDNIKEKCLKIGEQNNIIILDASEIF